MDRTAIIFYFWHKFNILHLVYCYFFLTLVFRSLIIFLSSLSLSFQLFPLTGLVGLVRVICCCFLISVQFKFGLVCSMPLRRLFCMSKGSRDLDKKSTHVSSSHLTTKIRIQNASEKDGKETLCNSFLILV